MNVQRKSLASYFDESHDQRPASQDWFTQMEGHDHDLGAPFLVLEKWQKVSPEDEFKSWIPRKKKPDQKPDDKVFRRADAVHPWRENEWGYTKKKYDKSVEYERKITANPNAPRHIWGRKWRPNEVGFDPKIKAVNKAKKTVEKAKLRKKVEEIKTLHQKNSNDLGNIGLPSTLIQAMAHLKTQIGFFKENRKQAIQEIKERTPKHTDSNLKKMAKKTQETEIAKLYFNVTQSDQNMIFDALTQIKHWLDQTQYHDKLNVTNIPGAFYMAPMIAFLCAVQALVFRSISAWIAKNPTKTAQQAAFYGRNQQAFNTVVEKMRKSRHKKIDENRPDASLLNDIRTRSLTDLAYYLYRSGFQNKYPSLVKKYVVESRNASGGNGDENMQDFSKKRAGPGTDSAYFYEPYHDIHY